MLCKVKRGALMVLGLTLLMQLFACSSLQRALKEKDWKKQLDAADRYFEKEQWPKASILYEDIMPKTIGQPEAERVMFNYAYCQFGMEYYMLSANYFNKFHTTYRRSPKAPEAFFMSAYSQFKDTPAAALDQSHTNAAIEALQAYVDIYSDDERVKQATECISELRYRLEIKAFEQAKLYQRLRRFKAAVIAFDNFRQNYPDSKYREEARFRELESQYELAKNSVLSLQEERYKELFELYLKFVDLYPKSDKLREAESIYNSAQRQLKTVKKRTDEIKAVQN